MARLYTFLFSLYVFMSLMSVRRMSTKAKKKKGEEQDFETFVRVTPGSLQKSVNAIKSAQEEKLSELNSLKARVSSNDALLSGISKEKTRSAYRKI